MNTIIRPNAFFLAQTIMVIFAMSRLLAAQPAADRSVDGSLTDTANGELFSLSAPLADALTLAGHRDVRAGPSFESGAPTEGRSPNTSRGTGRSRAAAGQDRQPSTAINQRRTVVELNGGFVRPHGSMLLWRGFDGRALFSDTGWGGMNIGVRVSRQAQIDFGFEFSGPVIGPDRESIDERLMRSSFGVWVPRDPNQALEDPVSDGPVFSMPFGPRFVWPLLRDHVVLGFGGGGAFLLHGEANDRVHPTLGRGCAATCENRYGFGGYGLVRIEFVPAPNGRIGFGIMTRYTRARLSGGGYLPRFTESRTPDEWLQVGGTIAVRF